MSLKNLLVGLLYRYKLVKQAVLNEYVKEARQRQLQYQQRIQQLINLHKADSLVKKANLISNLYQQALLAKLAATAQNKVVDDGKGAIIGLLGNLSSVLASGGTEKAPAPRPYVEEAPAPRPYVEEAPAPRPYVEEAPAPRPVETGKGGGGFGKLLMTAAKKELEKQRGGGNSGLWSEVLNALNEHKGQIALGAGGGLLALLGGALLAKKLRNRKRKKNNAQTPSSDAAAAATVEQELKDLITSTQKQQKKK